MTDVVSDTTAQAAVADSPQTTPVAETTGTGSETGGGAGSSSFTAETLQKWFEGKSAQEIFAEVPALQRLVDGKAGEIADRVARRRLEAEIPKLLDIERQKWETQREYQQRLNRRDAIVQNNDAVAAMEELRQQAQEHKEYVQSQAAESRVKEISTSAANQLWQSALDELATLPMPIRQKLGGQNWGNDVVTAQKALWKAIAAETATFKANEIAATKAKELEASVRSKVLAEANGREPSPDTGGGGAPTGALTQEEYVAHRHDAGWVSKNRLRMMEAAQAGRIRRV